MKKLLSLLSVLSISGTAVPTTIAASPYQKEKTINSEINYSQTNNLENLIRNKRENKKDIEFTCSGDNFFTKRRITGIFNPNSWEKIVQKYANIDTNKYYYTPFFSDEIRDAINQSYVDNKCDWEIVPSIFMSELIYKNSNKINDFWQKSSKNKKIKITIAADSVFSDRYNLIESLELIDDGDIYENKYLRKLWTDFDNDLSKESIDLGIIENGSDISILNKLKEKYPKLNISYFEVFEKKDYSFFDKSFSTKFKIKSNNELIYPIQNINNKFTFITKKWLNEDLPKLIDSENLIQNWKSNFINWQNEINRQMNKNLPKYGNDARDKALKRTWKGNNINELNNKLLSLNHILETIDSKFKLNELYSKVQNLEKDINELKSQINKLNQKISEIQNSLNKNEDLENCANIGGLISASTGWIPYIGTLISIVSGTAAAICTIANA